MKKETLKHFDAFSGFGGFTIACERNGIETIGFSEIDKYANSVLKYHWRDIHNFGDITKIDIKALPDFDLLTGGFPCQDLSIAKKNREGLKGSRSGLFYNLIEILKIKKPRYFLFENVASMAKNQKELITQAISEVAGKRIEPIMINASLVSAQNRKRLFWTNIPNITQPEDKGILLKDILEENTEIDERMVKDGKSFAITSSYNGAVAWNSIAKKQRTMVRIGQINKGGQGDRIYSTEGKSVSLSANGGGRGAKTGLYAVASRTYPRYKQYGIERKKQIEARKDDKANAMTTVQTDSMVAVKDFVRKLTPIECERLMTLPDNFTKYGINEKGEQIEISNTQRYKLAGNGVVVEVIDGIIKDLLKFTA